MKHSKLILTTLLVLTATTKCAGSYKIFEYAGDIVGIIFQCVISLIVLILIGFGIGWLTEIHKVKSRTGPNRNVGSLRNENDYYQTSTKPETEEIVSEPREALKRPNAEKAIADTRLAIEMGEFNEGIDDDRSDEDKKAMANAFYMRKVPKIDSMIGFVFYTRVSVLINEKEFEDDHGLIGHIPSKLKGILTVGDFVICRVSRFKEHRYDTVLRKNVFDGPVYICSSVQAHGTEKEIMERWNADDVLADDGQKFIRQQIEAYRDRKRPPRDNNS
jgi:hypothetical protein